MKQYQNRSTLKNTAKDRLAGKWGYSVSLILIMLVIVLGLSYLMAFILEIGMAAALLSSSYDSFRVITISTVILYIFSYFLAILSGLFNIGCYYYFLNIASGQRHSVGDLFFAFRGNFGKNLAVAAATVLPQLILLLPYQICAYFFQSTYNVVWALLMIVSLIIGLAIYVPVALSLSMSPMLLLDFPQYSAKEVLKRSIQITKGHKGRLFLLQLSFLPIYLLCVLSFAIGYLWAVPYMLMTYVLFYLDLMNPQVIETNPLYVSANV